MNQQIAIAATAFVSCSLRPEDREFIDLVEGILKYHGIAPSGTVGMYSASPESPAVLMRKNIPLYDMLVIVATPRYVQKDIQTGRSFAGLPEMVHVEAGMAYAAGKPIVVFVQKGTDIGSFLPQVTQYITLDGYQVDLDSKRQLIHSLLINTIRLCQEEKRNQGAAQLRRLAGAGLGVLGVVALLDYSFNGGDYDDEEEDEDRKRRSRKKRGKS
jgi:hypothetical protein